MGMNSLPKTVTRQRGDCDLNRALLRLSPASMLTTRLPSHPCSDIRLLKYTSKQTDILIAILHTHVDVSWRQATEMPQRRRRVH